MKGTVSVAVVPVVSVCVGNVTVSVCVATDSVDVTVVKGSVSVVSIVEDDVGATKIVEQKRKCYARYKSYIYFHIKCHNIVGKMVCTVETRLSLFQICATDLVCLINCTQVSNVCLHN